MSLSRASSLAIYDGTKAGAGCYESQTHQIQPRLAIILDAKRVGNIQSSLRVLEKQKDLMRPSCGSSFLGGERHAEGIQASERDWTGEGFVVGDPINIKSISII